MRIPFLPDKLMRNADLPLPIAPQEWHFRQSIDYSVTANRAVLDFAQRYRETLMTRQWQMGAEMIAAGSKDSWTVWPKRLQAMKDAIAAAAPRTAARPPPLTRPRAGGAAADPKFAELLRDPALRDPRGYIVPSNQGDFPTALKFIEKLQKNAIVVHRANAAFTVAGKSYPAGSIVVKTAQAYRPFIIDMFDPQDHPNDFRYPGAPPTPPYDNAGYTLALQMGVQFDRVLDGFDCPCDRIEPSKLVTAPAGTVAKGGTWKLSPTQNDAFAAVARFLKAGADVYRGLDGNFYVPATGKSRPVAAKAAQELGLDFAAGNRPSGAQKLTAPRIALFDRYGGQMPSGHTRWILEQFGIGSTDIFPQELDAGNLRARYDVIVFPDGSIPAIGGGGRRGAGRWWWRSRHGVAASRVAQDGRQRDRRQDGAAAQGLHAGWRARGDHRVVDVARHAPRPAGGEPSHRGRPAAAAGEVFRAGFDPAGVVRHHGHGDQGHGGDGERLL